MVTKNISFLQSGVYFFKINIDGVIINKKFIVN
ncbi:MAG: T9SS type A sorting domain-containing protein [Flavobacteriaceae bacterium]|nr:T9SS type A sorting domain-containing protein [Flavobacteriaceae bacterium]MBT6705765.1 T9SS type A sorting domain-containing protein [Flavobacteriaceae bacterium]